MRQIRLKIEFSSDFDKKNKLQKNNEPVVFFIDRIKIPTKPLPHSEIPVQKTVKTV